MPKSGFTRPRRIDTVFVLLVFFVFAASALSSITFGASAYKNAVSQSQERYEERTCLSYIWSKVKNFDIGGNVLVGDFNGSNALILREEWDGAVYNTYIYYHDGWLKELYGPELFEYDFADGDPVIEIKDGPISFETLSNGLIKASDSWGSIIITPRAGRAAAL